jgi:hypothetical protein
MNGVNVTSVQWAQQGQYLAIGTDDHEVRLPFATPSLLAVSLFLTDFHFVRFSHPIGSVVGC